MDLMNYVSRDVITVAPSDPIDKAMELLEDRRIHHLVVANRNRPVGMLSDLDILSSAGWLLSLEHRANDDSSAGMWPTRVEQIMSRTRVRLTAIDSIRDAATLMVHHRIAAAPIVRAEELIGVISETDLARALEDAAIRGSAAEKLLAQEVRSLMRSPVVSVESGTPLVDAIEVFRRFQVHDVPVVVNDALLGMISDRDARRALVWSGVRSQAVVASGARNAIGSPHAAGDVMQMAAETISPSAPLRAALRVMQDSGIYSLPVTVNHELNGMITQTDLIRAMARDALV